MGQGYVEIELCRASEDAKVSSDGFQQELREFSAQLRAAGVVHSQRGMAFDSADALGFPLPEFIVAAKWLTPSFVSILVAWIATRNGRKVRIKSGDIEVEGRTMREVQEAFVRVAERAKLDREDI